MIPARPASPIRPMTRSDLDAVASLYERVFRSGSPTPVPGLRAWFERMLFDHPWVDGEIPSLVALEGDGRVVGALCAHVRRLRIDGERARLAVSGPLMVAPEARKGAFGARLLRSYLAGPQELTMTDGATDLVRAIWERLGGVAAPLQSLEWWRPLRPWRSATTAWERRSRRQLPAALGSAMDVLDRATLRLAGHRHPALGGTEPLTPHSLTAELATVAGRLRLVPEYDPQFVEWLLAELASVDIRGELRARVVRDDGGSPFGYFVYFLVPGGLSSVLAIVGPDEASTASVLDALIDDAGAGGAAALHGRLEPRLLKPIARRRAWFRYVGRTLIHASDPAILGLALTDHSLLTRLEGDWWMAPRLGSEVR